MFQGRQWHLRCCDSSSCTAACAGRGMDFRMILFFRFWKAREVPFRTSSLFGSGKNTCCFPARWFFYISQFSTFTNETQLEKGKENIFPPNLFPLHSCKFLRKWRNAEELLTAKRNELSLTVLITQRSREKNGSLMKRRNQRNLKNRNVSHFSAICLPNCRMIARGRTFTRVIWEKNGILERLCQVAISIFYLFIYFFINLQWWSMSSWPLFLYENNLRRIYGCKQDKNKAKPRQFCSCSLWKMFQRKEKKRHCRKKKNLVCFDSRALRPANQRTLLYLLPFLEPRD